MQSVRQRVRAKKSDLIADELLRWVLLSGMGPGSRLPQERELVAMFGASRGTIRETLKSLEVQGLVEIVTGPQGGARLTEVPEARAMQLLTPYFHFRGLSARAIYETRTLLEPLMVRAAIDHLTGEDFAALRRTVEICQKGMAGAVGVVAHRAAELQFHHIIANRVPNVLFRFYCVFMNHTLYSFVTPKAVAQGEDRDFAAHTIEAHGQLIDALEAKDVERAVALMTEHIDEAGRLVEVTELTFDQARLDQSLSAGLDLATAIRGMTDAMPLPSRKS